MWDASRTPTRGESSACGRIHAVAGANGSGSAATADGFAWRCARAVLRRRRRRDMCTPYTKYVTDLHHGASVSARYPGLWLLYAPPCDALVSARAKDRDDVRDSAR